jgi:hypothetical protein
VATAATTTAATFSLFGMVVIMVMTVTTTALMIITMLVAITTAAFVIITMLVTMATAATVMAVVIISTMNVTMGNFFSSRGAHVTHGHAEMQVHTSQWMVRIHLDELFGHFDHGHRTMAIVGISYEGITFSHFHTVKQFTWYALYQIIFVFAVGFSGIDIQLEAVTDFAVIQRLFQTWNQETCTMQVNQRLAAFGAVQHVAGLVRNGIVEGNNAQMAYIHVRVPGVGAPATVGREKSCAQHTGKKTE